MRLSNLDGRLAIETDDGVFDVATASGGRFTSDPQSVYDDWPAFLDWARSAETDRGAQPFPPPEPARLQAPAPRPRQIKSGLLDVRRERKVVQSTLERFDIRPADPARLIRTLSGGNQQKVVLAKWLARSPKLLILDEPVQGIDVGAKADIFARLRATADAGTAVLVIDSDFKNLAELCDRVLVLRQGQIVDELIGARLTTDHMSKATFGVDDDSDLVHHASQEI